MIVERTGTVLAALSLTVGSAAVAQSAAPLSLVNSPALSRAAPDLEDASLLRGAAPFIVGTIVLALAFWGIIEIVSDRDEATPSSP